MSDPLRNDYSRAPSASESEETRAVLAVVTQAHRLAAPGHDAWDVLEALGIDERAVEMLRARGATRPEETPQNRSEPLVRRDDFGRLRAAPPLADANGIPPGQHGHNGRCASGDHAWAEENIRPGRPAKCRPCEHRRKWGVSSKPKDTAEIGLTKCKCPGMGHILTPYTSDTTVVDSRGQRSCRENANRRKRERRAAKGSGAS